MRMIIEIRSARKKRGVGRPCIFCGSNWPSGKEYAEGAIVVDRKFLWRYKGVVHSKCATNARKEKRRELGLP